MNDVADSTNPRPDHQRVPQQVRGDTRPLEQVFNLRLRRALQRNLQAGDAVRQGSSVKKRAQRAQRGRKVATALHGSKDMEAQLDVPATLRFHKASRNVRQLHCTDPVLAVSQQGAVDPNGLYKEALGGPLRSSVQLGIGHYPRRNHPTDPRDHSPATSRSPVAPRPSSRGGGMGSAGPGPVKAIGRLPRRIAWYSSSSSSSGSGAEVWNSRVLGHRNNP